MPGITIGEIEELFSNTILQVTDNRATLVALLATQNVIADSQRIMAEAVKSMADTFKRVEDRQEKLENINISLYNSKGVSPNVFFLVTGTLCSVIVLGAIWLTDTSIKATLTSFEAGKKQLELIKEAKDEIIDKVENGPKN